jgi:hypothetical protein
MAIANEEGWANELKTDRSVYPLQDSQPGYR